MIEHKYNSDPLIRMKRYPMTSVPAPDLILEGIAEIERIRARLCEASDEAQLARSTVTDLNIEVEKLRDELVRNADEFRETLTELRQRIETLTAERDEARRMVCGLDADIMEDQVEYARHRGWDCFPREDGK